jgi:glycosyltransferase involved in cell wall biosynthesis
MPAAALPRILFFTPSLSMGGAERHTITLRHKFIERGYPTSLISYGPSICEGFVDEVAGGTGTVLGLRGMSDLRGWRRAINAIHDEEPNVIFCVNQTPTIVAAVAHLLRATNALVVSIFHTTDLPGNEGSRLPLYRAAVAMIDAIVFVGANQRKFWTDRKLWSRHIEVIVNGIDLTRFHHRLEPDYNFRSSFGFANDDVVFGLVGQFRPEKNHILLIDAMAGLRRSGLPAKIVFVGDGPTRDAAESHAAQIGMVEHIRFTGMQDDVRPYIGLFDVGVLCSSIESFSVAALEQLASGVPMLITCHGGGSEVISDHVNGWLVDPLRPGELESALQQIARAGDFRTMRIAARNSALRFDIEVMVDRYERLTETLTARRVRGPGDLKGSVA